MDSLTQIALGSCVAAACVSPPHRRQAALLGIALGTLPDLDVFVDYGDPVANFTMHRGFTHAFLVLTAVGLVLWAVLRLVAARARSPATMARRHSPCPSHPSAPRRTHRLRHPTLLALDFVPASWATLFIIDPLYTLPLLAGMLAVLIRPSSRCTGRWLAAGLVLSTLYLGWSWTAKAMVTANARQTLAAGGLRDAPLFVTPTPFNTLLWRIVARTEDGHLEGLDSVIAGDGPIEFVFHPSDDAALAQAGNIPAAQRLQWFAGGFVSASMDGDTLILSDLRMGQHPNYVFRHAVAQRGNPHWHPIEPQRMPATLRTRDLAKTWNRIWRPTSDL